MDADLVHPARLEPDPQQRVAREELLELEVRDRLARRIGVERLAGRVAAVASDRRLDPARPRARLPAHEPEVASLELTVPNELLEAPVRELGARDHEKPRGVAVEPVDDALPIVLTPRGAVLDQRLGQRAFRVSRARVYDDAGRLVDDQEVLVLVRDAQIEAGRSGTLWGRLGLEGDLLALLDAIALRAALAVDRDGARRQEPFSVCARAEFVEGREKAVEPRAGELSGDADADDRRSPRRPAGARRRRR
jgi:hypothetical protein